eukprot:COSAG01_NODE_317_length_18969_cov_378.101219_17_plen_1851_part_00
MNVNFPRILLADDYRFVGPELEALAAAELYSELVTAAGHTFCAPKSKVWSPSLATVWSAASHPFVLGRGAGGGMEVVPADLVEDYSHIQHFGQLATQLTALDISNCKFNPLSTAMLVSSVRWAEAALEGVNLAFNKIGAEGGVALVEALKTSNIKFLGIGKQFKTADGSLITCSLLKNGVTLSLAGRVGEVTKIDSDYGLKLKWQDDQSESKWISISELDGEPLNLPVRSKFEGEILDVSQQQLDSGYAMILAWWLATPFSAVVTSINCLANQFGDEGLATLLKAIEGTSVRSLCGLIEGQKTADFSGQNLGPMDCKIMSAEFEFRGFIAVLNSLTVKSTRNITRQKTYTLTVGEPTIDLSSKHLGPADINLLAVWMQRPEVGGTITSLTVKSTGDMDDTKVYTLNADEVRFDLRSMNLGPADVALLATWLATTTFHAELKSLMYDADIVDDNENSLLHLLLQHGASTHVAEVVLVAEPGACRKPNREGRTSLDCAIDAKNVVIARKIFQRLEVQERENFRGKLQTTFAPAFRDTLQQLVNEQTDASVGAMKQLTAMLDLNLVNDIFVGEHGFAHLLPLLCQPDDVVYTAATEAIVSACNDDACVEALIAEASGGMIQRLVNLLVNQKGEVQVHAATALGRASKKNRDRVQEVLSKFADAAESFAMLTDSKDSTLAALAKELFDLAAPGKPLKPAKIRALQRMFEKPWPSTEFRRYEQERGWKKPSQTLRNGDGKMLIGQLVFVEGQGEGTIVGLKSSRGASEHMLQHEIDFVLMGRKKLRLKRKGNSGTPWLVPPDGVTHKQLIWQRNGGNATTTKMHTRGASNNDVCMWMYGQGGICRHYAGLFSWIFDIFETGEAAGAVLLNIATDDSQQSVLLTYVSIERHRKDLLEAIAGLAGFLGRYLLSPGQCIHTSATCVLILAEDRLCENEDGTLKKVALKCMKNKEQFLTELRMREGLDGNKVMSALRVHVPTGLLVSWLFGVEVLHDDTLKDGAQSVDKRLTGQYIIAMDCADCDLASDISHGHYAGRNIERVRELLTKIVECFEYCEKRKFIHGDIKPLNLVLISLGSYLIVKLIDFDASSKYGEPCHLKFSSAFAPPQLAAELLEYESTIRNTPADAPQDSWTEWVKHRGILTASVSTDIWAFGILAFKLCVKDGASMFHSSEADNIVEATDLCTLAYYWDLHKFEKVGRIMRLGPEWVAAADLLLWCLQTKPERRPQSFVDIRTHRFLNSGGVLHYFEPCDKTMEMFVQRQAKALTVAINTRNKVEVQQMFDHGSVHLQMVDTIIRGSTSSPLLNAAFVGDSTVTRVLLREIADSWPEDVRIDYLDQRTSLGLTAYMIACACGHQEIADLLVAKGCSTDLTNEFVKTGGDLAVAVVREHEQAVVTPFCHAAAMHCSCETLEEFLDMQMQRRNVHVDAGLRVWNAKQYVGHFDSDQMDALLVAILNQMTKTRVVALHFTDMDSGRLITHSLGIRASTVGQLGGGVSVCLKTLTDFGWKDGKDGVSFAKAIGLALWGSKWHEVLPLAEKTADAHADFGKWSKKLECVFIVSVPDAAHRDSGRILPGREDVYIIPKTDCITGTLLNEADTGMYLSNTNIEAMLILKQPDSVCLDATRVQITSGRDNNGGMVDVQMTAAVAGASISDRLDVINQFDKKVLRCTAMVAKLVAPQALVMQQHRMLQKQHVGKRLWLENVSRFKALEMKAGIEAIEQQLLHWQTIAFYYCSNATAQWMCKHGIAATVGDDGNCSLTVCLRTPSELGWQKNAAGAFRSNVAKMLEGVDKDDVQATMILAVPADIIRDAGCEGKGTFTFNEHVDQLEFLSQVEGQIVYAKAHVIKIYELEPASLV